MAKLAPLIKQQFFDENGDPLSGGKIYTYVANSSTPLATYTDKDAGTENTNPIILDANGEANFWVGDSFYKFVITDADDVVLKSVDYVSAASDVSAEAATSAAEAAASAAAALVSENNAETAETNAETAETNAEAAQAAAEAAQAAAEAAQTAAETAETNAETAETNAETAQGLAETARDAAAASAVAADASADAALVSETNAAASAALLASVWSTGDVKLTLKAVADTGWVLCDDGTIGNASSGATTRANADTADLFALLWNNVADTYAAVSSGRGASAAADFAANKTIGLTKMLGRALAVAGAGATLTSRAPGQTVGAETHTLISAEMPSHTHTQDAHTHTQNSHNHTQDAHTHIQDAHVHVTSTRGNIVATNDSFFSAASNNTPLNVSTGSATATNQNTTATNQAATATNQNATATNQNTGGDGSHNNMQPTSFLNAMIKL